MGSSMSKTYIHYGHERFDRNLFTPVSNCPLNLNKPSGGMWASPVDTERGWHDWGRNNPHLQGRFRTSFQFELSPDARVLELTPFNVWELPVDAESVFKRCSREERYGLAMVQAIDFEALAREYDVLECSLTDYPELYWSLYGWDCDSIVILNPDVIVEVTE